MVKEKKKRRQLHGKKCPCFQVITLFKIPSQELGGLSQFSFNFPFLKNYLLLQCIPPSSLTSLISMKFSYHFLRKKKLTYFAFFFFISCFRILKPCKIFTLLFYTYFHICLFLVFYSFFYLYYQAITEQNLLILSHLSQTAS